MRSLSIATCQTWPPSLSAAGAAEEDGREGWRWWTRTVGGGGGGWTCLFSFTLCPLSPSQHTHTHTHRSIHTHTYTHTSHSF